MRGHEGRRGDPVRLRYTKQGKVRWISHRDVARALERAFRITQLPLAFTEGFSPRPKVSFGLALSTGHESEAEYLDLVFADEVDVDALLESLTDALPDGHGRHRRGAARRSRTGLARSGHRSRVAGRDRPTDGTPIDASERIAAGLEATGASDARGGARAARSMEDVRPVIRSIAVDDESDELEMELHTQPRSAKPGDVLAAIGGDRRRGIAARAAHPPMDRARRHAAGTARRRHAPACTLEARAS